MIQRRMFNKAVDFNNKAERESFLLNLSLMLDDLVGAVNSIVNMKSGANQAAAGAVAGELWVDTSAGNVVKRGV